MWHCLCYTYIWHMHCKIVSIWVWWIFLYHCYYSWVLQAHFHKKRRPKLCHVSPRLLSVYTITQSWVCTMDVSRWWDFPLQSCGPSLLPYSPSCSHGSCCLRWTCYLSHLRCSCPCYDCQCSSFLKSLLHAWNYVPGVASKPFSHESRNWYNCTLSIPALIFHCDRNLIIFRLTFCIDEWINFAFVIHCHYHAGKKGKEGSDIKICLTAAGLYRLAQCKKKYNLCISYTFV